MTEVTGRIKMVEVTRLEVISCLWLIVTLIAYNADIQWLAWVAGGICCIRFINTAASALTE